MTLLYSFAIYCLSLLNLKNDVPVTISIIDSYGQIVEEFPTRFARYLYGQIDGYMEASIPPDACTEIYLPTFPQNYTLNKIVLINGTGECDFMTKVEKVKSAGYDTAVLFDPYPGFSDYPNLSFPLDVSELNISVVLISYDDAISINNYLYHNISGKENFIIEILREVTLKENLYLLCILLVVLFILWFVYKSLKCCVKGLRNRNAARNNADHPVIREQVEVIRNEIVDLLVNANMIVQAQTTQKPSIADIARALRKLERTSPSTRFSQEHKAFSNCVICFNDFQIGDMIRILACSHAYHEECIDNWFVEKELQLTCPMCQQLSSLASSCEQPSLGSTDSETAPLLDPTNDLPSASGYVADNSYSSSNCGSVNENEGFLAGDTGSVNSA